jgi:hypothetical protein
MPSDHSTSVIPNFCTCGCALDADGRCTGMGVSPAAPVDEGAPVAKRDTPENVVSTTRIPRASIAHEIVVTRSEVVVLGSPDDAEDAHDCDAMGCGYAHALLRIPLTLATPREPSEGMEITEAMKVAVARIFCRYGDTGFDWDDPIGTAYADDEESRAGILRDAERALRAALRQP